MPGVRRASAAQAQEGSWYIGANMPLMFIDDSEATSTTTFGQGQPRSTTLRSTVRSEHDTGYKLGGVLGHHLDSSLRVEGEIFLARAEVSKLTTPASRLARSAAAPDPSRRCEYPGVGFGQQLGAMVNLWYDFDKRHVDPLYWRRTRLHPHRSGRLEIRPQCGEECDQREGGGGGTQQPDAATVSRSFGAPWGPRSPLSTTDTAFAFQIGAGVGYALSDSTTLHIGYRLQALNGLTFSGTDAGVSTTAETDLRVHFLEIGIRYRF